MVEGENQLPQIILWPLHTHTHTDTHAHTYTLTHAHTHTLKTFKDLLVNAITWKIEVISGCGELVALSLRTLLILGHSDTMIRYNVMVRYKYFISEPVWDQNMGFFFPISACSCLQLPSHYETLVECAMLQPAWVKQEADGFSGSWRWWWTVPYIIFQGWWLSRDGATTSTSVHKRGQQMHCAVFYPKATT